MPGKHELILPPPAPLPELGSDLVDRRKAAEITLADELQRACRMFWRADSFKKWVIARHDGEAVEGSVKLDDTMCALFLRNQAAQADSGFLLLPKAPLRDVVNTWRRSTLGRRFTDLHRGKRLNEALLASAQAAAAGLPEPEGP